MLLAEILLNKKNHTKTESGYIFRTIFGNVFVRQNQIERHGNVVLVPTACFGKQGYNPCQMVSGFLRTVKQ